MLLLLLLLLSSRILMKLLSEETDLIEVEHHTNSGDEGESCQRGVEVDDRKQNLKSFSCEIIRKSLDCFPYLEQLFAFVKRSSL